MLADPFELVTASGPFPGYPEEALIYRPLIGSWDVDALWHLPDGSTRTARGEWHFAWILGGRGVQDVLFAAGSPRDQYGVTLRCYDPAAEVWRVTWMQPYGGEFIHLTGRAEGGRIVQEGQGTDLSRRERWSFAEITPDSFLWLGEFSTDGGLTWKLEQEMRGRRRL